MIVAPIPENELERLQELYEYKILDTPCEEIFDIITQLTAAICETPISTISLIDTDRQWLKSTYGSISAEAPRENAFCSHTILQSSLMEVLDAKDDERFFDNPFVTGHPMIRFYAGFPLISPKGLNIGSLCVIDTKPKQLTDTQKMMLEKLSKIVINLLEARKSILHDVAEKTEITKQLNERIDEQKLNLEFNHKLSEMNNMLQSCDTYEDAYVVIRKYCENLIPQSSGGLYVITTDQDYADLVTTWNDNTVLNEVLGLQECWALRRGQAYTCQDQNKDLLCKHIQYEKKFHPYICIPLSAQIETLGVLTITFDNDSHYSAHLQTLCLYAQRVAEQIALSLSNIKLRQKLRHQSIYDVLTGLHNRRYMEEVVHREIAHAHHANTKLNFAILDIDHFKNFNDKYGHDAGDLVLKEVAKLLQLHIHGNNIPFRLGGEEFLIMMTEGSQEEVLKKMELMREEIKKITVNYNGQSLDKISFSIGLSSYPCDGLVASELLNNADKALYQAKDNGRDRVVVFNKNLQL